MSIRVNSITNIQAIRFNNKVVVTIVFCKVDAKDDCFRFQGALEGE